MRRDAHMAAIAELDRTTPPREAVSASPEVKRAQAARRKRRRLVMAARIAIFVFIVGGWEICARAHIVDPFFFGEPSKIALQIKDWVANGTQAGSLFEQVRVLVPFGLAQRLPMRRGERR
jgi:hypothetical protein